MRKKSLMVGLCLLGGLTTLSAQNSPQEKMSMTLYALGHMYVDSLSVGDIVNQQIIDMMHKLDPFSEYLTPEAARQNEQLLAREQRDNVFFTKGYLTGFLPQAQASAGMVQSGIEGGRIDGRFLISYLPVESEAYKQGLRPGDEITAINGEPVSGLEENEIYAFLRGTAGKTVKLKTLRGGTSGEYTFQLKAISPTAITAAYMVDKRTGYIAISMFSNTTAADFRKRLQNLKAKGMKKLILDLRKNNGGLFDDALAIADEFIAGEKVMVYTEGLHSPRQVFKSTPKGAFQSGSLVVLINGQTKSAAEILSAALQDNHRAVFIGQRSFGKGLIQETLPFKDGSALRLTVARYFTPAGRSLQKPYTTTFTRYGLPTDTAKAADGGVVPDLLVADDARPGNQWIYFVTYAGVQTKAARDYVLDNRAGLLKKYPDYMVFDKDFKDIDTLLEQVVKVAGEANIPFKEDDYRKSLAYLRVQMKGLVARNLYNDTNAYFETLNEASPAYREACKVLSSPAQYKSLLNKQK